MKKVNITLNKEVFGIEPNDTVLYDAITLARNAERQGTHSTKTRSEVSGGGRKPWRQKGTGRARQGSIRAPHWYHGGIVFGPTPEKNYTKKQNRKERRLALKSILSYKALENEIIVVDEFKLATNKTKDAIEALKKLGVEKKTLIIVDELDDNTILATRNLNNVMLLEANEINVLDLVASDEVVITEKAVKQIEEALQ